MPNAQYNPVGYTFKNYSVLGTDWGEALTADDIRFTYLAGINLTLTNGQEVQDEQLCRFVDMSVSEFESFFDLSIRRRIYRTNYTGDEPRTARFENSEVTKWTHKMNPLPFIKRDWESNGYIALPTRPLISVERLILKTPVDSTLINLLETNWVRQYPTEGRLQLYPRNASGFNYGPYLGSAGLILNRLYGDYADGYEVDFTAGYESSDFIPEHLRNAIGELAAVGCLNWVGDGLIAGFSSSSVSLDGLSESFSSTQSATSAYFGARIKEYREHLKNYIVQHRFKFSQIPFLTA